MGKKELIEQDKRVVLYALAQQKKVKINGEGSFNISVSNIQSLTGFSTGYVHKLLLGLQSDRLILLEHPKARVNLCNILTSDLPDREWFERVTGRSSIVSKMQDRAAVVVAAESATQNDVAADDAVTNSFAHSVKGSQGSSYFVRTNNCLSVKDSMQVAKLKTEYKTVRERLAEASK